MTYNEKKYNDAVKAVAEQIVAMAREDGDDDEHVKVLIEDYTADAIYDITSKAKEINNS